MQGIDLSCWKLAYNGAEPVRADTIERFASTFGTYGFNADSMHPAYGMAEAVLLISSGERGNGPVIRTVSHDALLVAFHAQPAAALSAVVPLPPAAAKVAPVGLKL